MVHVYHICQLLHFPFRSYVWMFAIVSASIGCPTSITVLCTGVLAAPIAVPHISMNLHMACPQMS